VADRPVGRQELAELADAAVEAEGLLALAAAAAEAVLVPDDDGQARHEERGLPGPLVQRLQGELGVLEEDLAVSPVAHARAVASLGDFLDFAQYAADLEIRIWLRLDEHSGETAPEADRVGVPTAVHLDVQAGGQLV